METYSSRELAARDPRSIRDMFAKVADKYDQANSILSFGIHQLWRSKLVRWAALQPGERVLDCATGTGDLAIKLKLSEPRAQVTGTDFCEAMLKWAPQKARNHRLSVQFLCADAMSLPFPDHSFDVVTISFGIRNVANPETSIREMARVLKPNGRLLILEFGQPHWPVLASAYHLYSKWLLPYLGGLVTGQPEAYRYLQNSSARFPCGPEFVQLIQRSFPFQRVNYRTLSAGIAYVYRADRWCP